MESGGDGTRSVTGPGRLLDPSRALADCTAVSRSSASSMGSWAPGGRAMWLLPYGSRVD